MASTIRQASIKLGTTMPFSTALAEVLISHDKSGDELYIWIDQLCINQEDPREKAHQVAMMGLIYWHAKEIVAYIGEPDGVSRHIFSEAAELEAGAHVNEETVTTGDAQGHSIAELMERPWFHRVWIIQETLLARRITLRVGDQSMSWDTFAALCESTHAGHFPPVCSLNDKYVPSLAIHSNLIEVRQWYLSHFQKEQDAHRSVKMSEPFSSHIFKFTEFREVPSTGVLDYSRLFDVLKATWHFDATVKRDKLFAVLSLFEGSVPPELEPDYVKSEKQVWQDLRAFLTRKCETSSEDVDMLLGRDEDEVQENVTEESVVEDSTSPPEEKSKPLPIISPSETKDPRKPTRFKVLERINPFRHQKHG
ncbi:hypothetical protein PRZ48_012420 [Zasmidium cellare]|uniref:Heterokaryon incompatibility domain-containing protein n=1 Tax=Zasmidium cellare TaxID=395010 RepID=A0ABR0E4Z9_ZASCE|nr:hypothetical protein PRZ48_012420 [Zasmidium cellare]